MKKGDEKHRYGYPRDQQHDAQEALQFFAEEWTRVAAFTAHTTVTETVVCRRGSHSTARKPVLEFPLMMTLEHKSLLESLNHSQRAEVSCSKATCGVSRSVCLQEVDFNCKCGGKRANRTRAITGFPDQLPDVLVM